MGDISHYFNRSEFACKCGCGFDTVDTALLEAVREIRRKKKARVIITSGCRCAEHNKAVGGSPRSQHVLARAADIVVDGVTPDEVAELAESLEGVSVGRYNTFTHLDTRSGPPARWDFRTPPQ